MIQYLCNYTTTKGTDNISFDEALLNDAEENNTSLLRFWQCQDIFVVLGRSNESKEETYEERCQEDNIPIIKRCSGGGTILQGPFCLNYSLILPIEQNTPTETIGQTNDYILEKHQQALSKLTKDRIEVKGYTDLTL